MRSDIVSDCTGFLDCVPFAALPPLPMNSITTRALARELLLPCETLFVALPPPGRQSRGEGGHDVRAVAPARDSKFIPHDKSQRSVFGTSA